MLPSFTSSSNNVSSNSWREEKGGGGERRDEILRVNHTHSHTHTRKHACMRDRQLYLDIEVDELERLSKDVAIVRDARDLPPTSYLYRRGEERRANEFT